MAASPPSYAYCQNVASTRAAVDGISRSLQANPILALDLEWNSHDPTQPLSLIQASTTGAAQPIIFDTVLVPSTITEKGRPNGWSRLKDIFADPFVVVVMHAATHDKILLQKNGAALNNLFDTQVAHEVLRGSSEKAKGLKDVLRDWLQIEIDKGGQRMHNFMRTPNAWAQRPLPDYVLEYAANDVRLLPQLYVAMKAEADRLGCYDDILKYSANGIGELRKQRKEQQSRARPEPEPTGAPSGGDGTGSGELKILVRKPEKSSLLGIRLAGAQGPPRVIFVNQMGLAAVEHEGRRLRVGDLVKAVNSVAADGHEMTTSMLRDAVGVVRVDVVRSSAPPAADAAPSGAGAAAAGDAPAGSTVEGTAIDFGKLLMRDGPLRARCGTKETFASELIAWKKHEHDAGRPRRGSPSDVIFKLRGFITAVRRLHGLPRVQVYAGVVRISILDGTEAHRAEAAESVHENRERIEADKGGVTVSPRPNELFNEVVSIGSYVVQRVVVSNHSKVERRMSAKLTTGGKGGAQREIFQLSGDIDSVPLAPGASLDFTVAAQPISVGLSRDILSITFGTFSIGRYLEVQCGDADLHEMLKPKAKYVKQKRKPRGPLRHQIQVEPGVRPSGGGMSDERKGPKLKAYALETSPWRTVLLRSAAEGGLAEAEHQLMIGRERMHELRAGVADAQAQKEYAMQQSRLLHTEELQLGADLRNFDFDGEHATVLTKRGGLLWLKV